MTFLKIPKRKEQSFGLRLGTLVWRGNSIVTDVYVVSNSSLSNVYLKALYDRNLEFFERNIDALKDDKIFIFYADGFNRIIDYDDFMRN